MSLAGFFKKLFFKDKEFHTWLNRPHIKSTLKTLTQLYKGINTLETARQAWERHQFRDYAFIYGEIDIISFIAMLEAVSPQPGEVFYDLGSGAGKAVFTAALAFEFNVCKGIELVPELYNLSCQLQNKLPALKSRIEFINADFLTMDIQDADIVFINAACFMGEAWQAIITKLKTLKSGTRIILGAKRLPEEQFKLINDELRYMSWGKARVYIYCCR